MKGFKNGLKFLAIAIFLTSASPIFAFKLSAFFEKQLRRPLNLIVGPATQVVDFRIGEITYIVLISDLSFSKNISNPFGNEKNEQRTSEKAIEKAVYSAFKQFEKTVKTQTRPIYLIIFDKQLFGNINTKTVRKFIFKAEFRNGKLLSLKKLK